MAGNKVRVVGWDDSLVEYYAEFLRRELEIDVVALPLRDEQQADEVLQQLVEEKPDLVLLNRGEPEWRQRLTDSMEATLQQRGIAVGRFALWVDRLKPNPSRVFQHSNEAWVLELAESVKEFLDSL